MIIEMQVKGGLDGGGSRIRVGVRIVVEGIWVVVGIIRVELCRSFHILLVHR